MLRKTAHVSCAVIVAAAALSGCRTGFTREDFDTIYEGQPADAVVRRLGRPDRKSGQTWIYVNERPDYYRAEIRFKGGLVAGKTWFDTRDGPAGQ